MERVAYNTFNLPQSGSAEVSVTTSDRGGGRSWEETHTQSVVGRMQHN